MKLNRIGLVIISLSILLICLGNASANDFNAENPIDINDTQENSILSVNNDASNLKENNEIEVDDWEDLQYYCSLSDKNYNLKLKENTNYYPNNPSDDSYQITVNNNVTITGSEGAYIGDSFSTPRNITYTPIQIKDNSGIGVILNGVTFKNIATMYQTDAIFFSLGGNVNNIFKDCSFENIITSGGHSSVLHIRYGDLTVINCSFLNCTTDFGCISVYCPTDSIGNTPSARMDISDSYFEGNYAKTASGCINNCGLLIVRNTTFYKNSAFWWAGAIHTHGGGNTTIYDSNFIYNVAGWNGGALYTYSILRIYNSNFTGNNCTTNNGGGAIGASLYLSVPSLYIEGSIFKDNNNNCWSLDDLSTSGTGRGGAISIMDASTFEVKESTFIHNSASMGSAIAVTSGGANKNRNIILTGNKFINNTKRGDVLYIYVSSSTNIEIHDNIFENSTIELSKLRISANTPVDNEVIINIDAGLINPSAYDEDILDKIKYNVYVDGVYYKTVAGKRFTYTFNDEEKHNIYITSSISDDVSNTISLSSKVEYIYLSKNSGNDSNNGSSRTSPVATLSKAISLANETGTIIIMDGTYTENNLNINYDLAIIGENNVVISNTTNNLFTVNASVFTLKNIQFSNLNTNSQTLISVSDLLILDNCQFIGGTYSNGIVANEIIMDNTIFNSITTSYYLINSNILTADNISIINNIFTSSSLNHGLLMGEDISTWNIINSNFSKNTNLRAGCIYLKGKSSSKVNLYNITFDSNRLYTGSSTAYTSGIYINSQMNVNIGNSYFTNNENSYNSRGALIRNNKANLNIVNCVLLNNTHGPSSTLFYDSPSSLPKITPNYNWFGNSMGDTITTPDLNSQINYNLWYVLNCSSNLTKLGDGEKALLTFDLNYLISRTGEITYYTFINPYEVKLSLTATNGILNTDEVTLIDGMAQIEFTKTGFDDATIYISYLGGNNTIKIQGGKNNPTLSIDTTDITAGDNLTINVFLTSDATGETTLYFNNESYILEFNNGKANKTFNNVKAGNYTIFVSYEGDFKYDSVNATKSLTVNQLDSFININVNESYYVDEEIIVSVDVPQQATGNITLNIGDKTLTKEVLNGQALFNLSGISSGDYNLTALFYGSIRYRECEETLPVRIFKYETQTVISANLNNLQLGDELTVIIHITPVKTGFLTINHNGESKEVEITNGQALYTINYLTKGDHLIKATYEENWKYTGSNDSISFPIGKLNSTVQANVENIIYGENATVIVTPIQGATGNVTVTVDNKSYTGYISQNKAIIYIQGLNAGNKTLTVVYNGDNDYLPSNASTTFRVSKANSTFEGISNSIMVGDTVLININFDKNMTGSFTLNNSDTKNILKGGNFKGWELKNLNPGTYTYEIYYSGDDNFNPSASSTTFTVNEYPAPQVSNGNNEKSQFEGKTNGKILFTINLENNINGSIVIDSEGNIYFASNKNLFAYSKNGVLIWNYSSDEVQEGSLSGAVIGRNILISPESGNRLLFVNITSGNENKHSNMYQGSSLFSPFIDENYNIYITSEYQNGDGDYKLVIIPYTIWQTSTSPTMISIGNSKPISAPVIIDENNIAIATENGLKIIDVSSKNIVYSSPVKLNNINIGHGGFIYALSDDSVICIINQVQQWKTIVTGGAGNYLAIDKDLGYLYSVNNEGILYKYDIANGEETLVYDFNDKVTSNILIDNEGVLYLGTENGMFYSLDNEGNIFWKVNINEKIISSPVMDEEGFIYVITNSSIVKLVNDNLKDAEIKVNIKNITCGENLTIELEFGEITGNISISIDGKLYNTSIISNKNNLIQVISNLPAKKYTVTIKYSGDKRFKENNINVDFSVIKQNLNPDDISNNKISENGNMLIAINLPPEATGNLTVFIDNKTYKTVDVLNGVASISIPNLSAGNHLIEYVYSGDDKYESVSKSISVNIPNPHVPVIKLMGSDVVMLYTSGSSYKVRLTSDGTALSGKKVTITINGVINTVVTDKNGYADVKINLPPKSTNYIVTAEYNGIKTSNTVKVNSILSAKNLKVKKSAKTLKIKVTLKKVNGKYIKSKKVSLKFNGKTYKVKTNKKGVATFKIPKKAIKKLKAGKKYTYQVTFMKDIVKKTLKVKK